jgi:tRNA(fMet)-specific endonuclease VapC
LGQLVRVVPVFFDTSQTLCHHYAVEANRLRTVGTPISGNDLWIACHALMLGAVLVTNNLREFARIERLRLENWVA